MCGAPITPAAIPPTGARVWIIALIQLTLATTFMLVFSFPKPFIAISAVIILLATALSSRRRLAPITPRPAPQKPLSHPVLFRVLSLAIALCFFAIMCCVFLGTPMFLNAWTRWHQYEGQPYHRSDFQVANVYYMSHTYARSGPDFSASGTVDGNREWIDLRPLLHPLPQSQGELQAAVPLGTSIPIYFFPKLKGRARVQPYQDSLPSEVSHRTAMTVLTDDLGILALAIGIMFLLIRARRICYVEDSAFPASEPAQRARGAAAE